MTSLTSSMSDSWLFVSEKSQLKTIFFSLMKHKNRKGIKIKNTQAYTNLPHWPWSFVVNFLHFVYLCENCVGTALKCSGNFFFYLKFLHKIWRKKNYINCKMKSCGLALCLISNRSTLTCTRTINLNKRREEKSYHIITPITPNPNLLRLCFLRTLNFCCFHVISSNYCLIN